MGNQESNIKRAVGIIKAAILRSQHTVAKEANRDILSLSYGIGKYISEHTRYEKWGTNAIDTISLLLKKELPGLRGYSASALKRMRTFYEEWSVVINRPLTVGENEITPKDIDEQVLTIRPLVVGELDWSDFLSLSFTHHSEILAKTDTLEQRIFYIRQAVINNWNKERLIEELKQDSYSSRSMMPNNFQQSMPDKVSALKAIEMFKDNYLLDFINTEELGVRDLADVDERIVEKSIVHNIKNFIMTFGRDFTFVGNQYHLEKYGVEQFPDLLFYNRELAALVCVELKFGDFKPAYLGQLSAYLRILDSEVKKSFENPSIGIVLCKNANRSFVEFLIQGYDNPMGVATYKTREEIQKILPSEEQLMDILNETND